TRSAARPRRPARPCSSGPRSAGSARMAATPAPGWPTGPACGPASWSAPTVPDEWRGRMLLDWGPIPGSYGWVFPKGDRLTVGVIASRGQGERTRCYLRYFTARLGLAAFRPDRDSG